MIFPPISFSVGSAGWGEAGYIRVAMKGDGIGLCGMYQEAYHAPTTFTKTLSGEIQDGNS